MDFHRQLGGHRTGIQDDDFKPILPALRPVAEIVFRAAAFQHRAADANNQARNGQRHAAGRFRALPRQTGGFPFRIHEQIADPCQPQQHGGGGRRPASAPQTETQDQRDPQHRVQRRAFELYLAFGHFIDEIGQHHRKTDPKRSQKEALGENKDSRSAAQQNGNDCITHG